MNSFAGLRLDGKVVVITGATGVLGEAFIAAVAGAGASVGILGRNQAVAEKRAASVLAAGGKAIPLIADVTDESQVDSACRKMLDEFGHIDGLVNAAGGNMPGAVVAPDADLFNLDLESLRRVMELNLFGTLIPVQIFGKEISRRGGAIVNISSMTAQRAVTKVLGYSLAKAAIDCYTRWFAAELGKRFGDKIRMNAIAPGFFLTEQNRNLLTQPDGSLTERGGLVIKQTPFQRFGAADELGGVLVWLLSDSSAFVTGTVVNVDGGFSIFSGV